MKRISTLLLNRVIDSVHHRAFRGYPTYYEEIKILELLKDARELMNKHDKDRSKVDLIAHVVLIGVLALSGVIVTYSLFR